MICEYAANKTKVGELDNKVCYHKPIDIGKILEKINCLWVIIIIII